MGISFLACESCCRGNKIMSDEIRDTRLFSQTQISSFCPSEKLDMLFLHSGQWKHKLIPNPNKSLDAIG